MQSSCDGRYSRRRLLRGGLGLIGAAGLGVYAGSGYARAASAGPDEPGLPPVPGMLGDRVANEFWYEFDEATYFQQTPQLKEAYAALAEHVGGNPLTGVRDLWVETAAGSGYPESFAASLRPVWAALEVVSRTQVDAFHRFYAGDPGGTLATMSYFAQGVLFDPRRAPVQSEVHTMDGDPPLAYHTWHAYQYASVLLGIDRRFWAAMIPVNGFAWALQSIAKPHTRTVNPPQPATMVRRVATAWLPLGVRQVDASLLAYHHAARRSS